MVRKTEAAYTLLEIIIVLSISAILARFAIINFTGIRQTTYTQQVEYQLEAVVAKALDRARRSGGRAIIRTSDDGRSYSLGLDDYPFSDAPPTADEIIGTYPLRAQYRIEPGISLIFNHNSNLIDPDGRISSKTFSVTESFSGQGFSELLQISITATGQLIFSKP